MNSPVHMRWDGDVMRPLSQRQADKAFVVGETYPLVEEHERSRNSHNHYFAIVHDCWLNLPETLKDQHPTTEHLRKWALIKAGFCTERDIVCASEQDAVRAAGLVTEMDEYAIALVRGTVVKCWRAKSQSVKAMGKDEFQRSKQAVLDVLASLVHVSPAELQSAGAAA